MTSCRAERLPARRVKNSREGAKLPAGLQWGSQPFNSLRLSCSLPGAGRGEELACPERAKELVGDLARADSVDKGRSDSAKRSSMLGVGYTLKGELGVAKFFS